MSYQDDEQQTNSRFFYPDWSNPRKYKEELTSLRINGPEENNSEGQQSKIDQSIAAISNQNTADQVQKAAEDLDEEARQRDLEQVLRDFYNSEWASKLNGTTDNFSLLHSLSSHSSSFSDDLPLHLPTSQTAPAFKTLSASFLLNGALNQVVAEASFPIEKRERHLTSRPAADQPNEVDSEADLERQARQEDLALHEARNSFQPISRLRINEATSDEQKLTDQKRVQRRELAQRTKRALDQASRFPAATLKEQPRGESTGDPPRSGKEPEEAHETRKSQYLKRRNQPSTALNKFAETSANQRRAPKPQEDFNPTAMFHIKTPAASSPPKVAIIGGTGLDQDSSLFKEKRLVDLPETPYGEPSDKQVVEGKIGNTTVVLLARHGKDHHVNPSNVNYRANIWALKNIGCHIVLATTACGSLMLGIPPGHLVVLDQYIDRTKGNRESSFHKVAHIPQGDPFDEEVRRCIVKACHELGYDHNPTGTCVTIEGPRFSTKAESNLYKSWGASVVNMTTVPEAPLVAELGMHYAALALVTDYDCWHDSPDESVNVELVNERMRSIREKAHMVLIETIKKIEQIDWQIPHARKMRIASQAVMTR